MYDRLGDILRDRLDSDEDPFAAWEPEAGKAREAGNARTRTPSPKTRTRHAGISVPKELGKDFIELGLEIGAPLSSCKKAWKSLLLTHHPDLHENDWSEQEKSNARVARINDSWRRISLWYENGTMS
jgi:hypothetical protein